MKSNVNKVVVLRVPVVLDARSTVTVCKIFVLRVPGLSDARSTVKVNKVFVLRVPGLSDARSTVHGAFRCHPSDNAEGPDRCPHVMTS